MLYETRKKVNGVITILILSAIMLAVVGFVVTWGRAILELTYSIIHYLEAATEALKHGKLDHTDGSQGNSLYSYPGREENLA